MVSKYLKNKRFSVLRYNEVVEYIRSRGYVTWKELELNLGMKVKVLRRLLRHNELCVCLNSKRRFFTLRSVVFERKSLNSPLWVVNGKVFSYVGNLKKTVLHLVRFVPEGVDEKTLSEQLCTPTKNMLKDLREEKLVKAVPFEGRKVYFSTRQKRFAKQFPRRLAKENCNEIQVGYEEFFQTLDPEVRKIAQELIPQELQKASSVEYKEFVKLLLIEPKLAYTSDRQMSRLLQNNKRVRGMIKPGVKGHSTISKYKDQLTVDFYVKMFEYLVEKVLTVSGLKEVTILVDCTVNDRYKRDNIHFRCHTASIAELKCPIALIITKGHVHESPVFERLLSKIEKLKIKIKYVICDAGYDSGKIYVRVAKRLKCIAVIPTRETKKQVFERNTFQISLDYFFKDFYNKEVQELVETRTEEKAGIYIRELVTQIKKLDWWKQIYKMRTGIERLFSWMKSFLGLTKPNGFSLKQVTRHAYQCFSFAIAQALCALKLGVHNKTVCYRSFII